jgi:hypothetical protein
MDWEKIKLEPYHPWPKHVPVPKDTDDPAWIDVGDPRIKVSPKQRGDWATQPGTYVKFDERVIGKDAGMNVLLTKAGNTWPLLIKEAGQLNSIIHNTSEVHNIVLVPANNENIVAEANITNGNLANGVLA